MHDQQPAIDLERNQPDRNMARFYSLAVESDLFGTILARRRWGRIGTVGRALCIAHPTAEEAWLEVRSLERLHHRNDYECH